ncbi:MAG: hypothetical protein HY549_13150 [Elusimicrobia bacterium]|nr:hypothetical protein [Elusimicrobiota bacterium]
MKKSRSIAPKSPLGRILAADGASIPILRRGGISACVRSDRDDSKLHGAKSSFIGAPTFSPHIFFKIPLTATQRDIRAAVKELLKHLSGMRGPADEGTRRAAWARLEEGREALTKISDSDQRRRKLDGTLARVADRLEDGQSKTVGELRGESRAPFASQTGAAAFRRKRNRWIRRRYEKLGQEHIKSDKRYEMIHDELLRMGETNKSIFGHWVWKKQNPFDLREAMIQKIIWHKRL